MTLGLCNFTPLAFSARLNSIKKRNALCENTVLHERIFMFIRKFGLLSWNKFLYAPEKAQIFMIRLEQGWGKALSNSLSLKHKHLKFFKHKHKHKHYPGIHDIS